MFLALDRHIIHQFSNANFSSLLVCYVVDVAIAPFAAPVAAYLAPMCPAIGVTVGSFGSVIAGSKVAGHA